jgi:hypothetical protein
MSCAGNPLHTHNPAAILNVLPLMFSKLLIAHIMSRISDLLFIRKTLQIIIFSNWKSVAESPVILKRIGEINCTATKVAKIESAVRKKIFGIPSDEGTSALPAGPDSIILQQLKEKF